MSIINELLALEYADGDYCCHQVSYNIEVKFYGEVVKIIFLMKLTL